MQLNIPKVEDGNNFGVSIQEESVNDLAKAEDTSFSLLDGINKYFMTRGKLVSRLGKYPGVKDYLVSIQVAASLRFGVGDPRLGVRVRGSGVRGQG